MTADELLHESPYLGYTYAYPHKTAYRWFSRPIPLKDAWADEKQDALFLYLHLPFCSSRCGYCNLFSLASPDPALVRRYLDTLARQAQVVRTILPNARFSRLAFGGGTPTLLNTDELDALFLLCREVMGVGSHKIPVSVEVAPATVTREKLDVLRRHGVDRISLGVQSFNTAELRWLGRSQDVNGVHHALSLIREAGFPVLNIDLIYGGEMQTMDSWLDSVRKALRFVPEELYLYPLYARSMTTLAYYAETAADQRLAAYRAARSLLLEQNYRQVSQRMFHQTATSGATGPAYCCQLDGMVGLGCGARSYTRHLHYATEYAVDRSRIAEIIRAYTERSCDAFAHADYGFMLNDDERRRRYLLKTLLLCSGTDREEFREEFGVDVLDAFPSLGELEAHRLAEMTANRICLTPAGIERGDAIGPWLYSANITRLMEGYTWA
ncbi:MAG: STM4012 family radical SAM protein [Armatimonadota bacterium]